MGDWDIRVFFAIELSPELKKSITGIVSQLKTQHKQSAIRWVDPRHYHITLQFIAKINDLDVKKLVDNVRAELINFSVFHLELRELELFPRTGHPHVIAMQIAPHEVLENLAERIGRGILATNYPIETRPFRGHLTLGRLNQAESILLEDITVPKMKKMLVKEIILFQSEPSKEGSKYTALDRIELS